MGGPSEREPVSVWCSNDYLGLSQHPDVIAAMCDAAQQHGVGAGGTRNIAGSSLRMQELETRLASFHKRDAALVFSSGYIANSTTLAALATAVPNTIVLSDAKNHASMIEGLRLARCEKIVFPHNDIDAVRTHLEAEGQGRPVILAVESVYSMDADKAPLAAFCQLADEYGALLYVDEVHAIGLYGQTGAGVAEEAGVADRIDVLQGTLGKAAGVMGGYITGDTELVDYVRSFGGGFIFTTALPPCLLRAASVSIDLIRQGSELRDSLFSSVNRVRSMLDANGFTVLGDSTHILPVLVPGAEECREFSHRLLSEHAIYLQPINYPTVPKGSERLRITPGPLHSLADERDLIQAMCEVRESIRRKRAVS